MLNPSVLSRLDQIQHEFQSAKPFRHVCVENFFQPEVAEELLRDFPPFDPEKARNEFGEIGGKAVVTDIRSISPAYSRVYDYIFSPGFLADMSRMTGIPDLQGDPSLYGGGTHDNRNGQALDPHVDFNFLHNGVHRRVNLLLYLNKEWDPEWGGAIEMHSNPRRPDENQITDFNVTFNRAVLFETNEHSWHGFPRIKLPADKQHLSRKCLSIYLYTKTRPQEEVAGPHGTFYVQRPLDKRFVPGHTLTVEDVEELRTNYRARDNWIEKYQHMESDLGQRLEDAGKARAHLEGLMRAPLVGFAQQVGPQSGLYDDNWATGRVSLEVKAVEPITTVTVKGWTPEHFPTADATVTLNINGVPADIGRPADNWSLQAPIALEPGQTAKIELTTNLSVTPKAAGLGGDERALSYILQEIRLT